MSNFLFRMVGRAAGLATVATPQPPPTFQWMGSAATLPSQYPATATSAWETQAPLSTIESLDIPSPLRQPTAKANPLAAEAPRAHRSVDVQSSLQPSVPEASSPTASTFPLENAGETRQPLTKPLPAVQSKAHRDVRTETKKEEGAPRLQNRLSENTEQTAHNANVPERQHRDLPAEATLSKRQPLARRADGPIIADHEAARFPLEEPAQQTSIHTVQSATPLPRESRTQSRDVTIPKPASEPPVEVKIGRVEIHFDAPATPAASPAPARPGGFSEYAELRRYVSRKR